MPLLSRACMVGLPSKPRPASYEPFCYEQYDECVKLCEGATTTDCVDLCQEQRQDCLEVQELPNDDSSSEWTCDIGDWMGGLDCSADSYDEGESDGEDEDDWGEDWGERLPAGSDDFQTPNDLPTSDS
jgi:hypothetical protein